MPAQTPPVNPLSQLSFQVEQTDASHHAVAVRLGEKTLFVVSISASERALGAIATGQTKDGKIVTAETVIVECVAEVRRAGDVDAFSKAIATINPKSAQ